MSMDLGDARQLMSAEVTPCLAHGRSRHVVIARVKVRVRDRERCDHRKAFALNAIQIRYALDAYNGLVKFV